ncbi:MAG: hypothetical protein ABI644_12600 [Arenimonas sp.]
MNIKTVAVSVAVLLFTLMALSAQAACPFSRMAIKTGMPRLELETQVAAVLGEKNSYSPYGNNLLGGTVSYRSGNCKLKVTFAPGSPAPRIAVASGGTEHLPPKDETVLSHQIIFASSKKQH